MAIEISLLGQEIFEKVFEVITEGLFTSPQEFALVAKTKGLQVLIDENSESFLYSNDGSNWFNETQLHEDASYASISQLSKLIKDLREEAPPIIRDLPLRELNEYMEDTGSPHFEGIVQKPRNRHKQLAKELRKLPAKQRHLKMVRERIKQMDYELALHDQTPGFGF